MNKYILCLIVTLIPACSSMTSETYTEKRTLKYQKGTHPHIKDMYLHDRNNGEVSSHGVNPVNNNNVMVAPVEPVSTADDWDYVNPDLPEKQARTYEDIQNENKLLLAQYYNNWLRE